MMVLVRLSEFNIFCGPDGKLRRAGCCLLFLEMRLMKPVRLNQNSKVAANKARTMSLQMLKSYEELQKWVITFCGFVTTSDTPHITHGHLTHSSYKDSDGCSFNAFIARLDGNEHIFHACLLTIKGRRAWFKYSDHIYVQIAVIKRITLQQSLRVILRDYVVRTQHFTARLNFHLSLLVWHPDINISLSKQGQSMFN